MENNLVKENNLKDMLISKFGNIELSAINYIAFVCSVNDWDKSTIIDIYCMIGNHFGKSYTQVERSIRYYIQVLTEEYSVEGLNKIFNYHSITRYSNLELLKLIDRLYNKEVAYV